jgi:hypothetical protein
VQAGRVSQSHRYIAAENSRRPAHFDKESGRINGIAALAKLLTRRLRRAMIAQLQRDTMFDSFATGY